MRSGNQYSNAVLLLFALSQYIVCASFIRLGRDSLATVLSSFHRWNQRKDCSLPSPFLLTQPVLGLVGAESNSNLLQPPEIKIGWRSGKQLNP